MESLKEYKHVNFFGMYEDDVLVSTMKLIDFDMNFFGEMRRATGLMALGVHPLHKKKGMRVDTLCGMLAPLQYKVVIVPASKTVSAGEFELK